MSANPDNTFLQLLQRLGQQKDYTLRQLAIARDPAAAGLDRAKATFAVETTPLQVILGLGMEGANNVAKAATGAFLGGAGALGNLTGPQDLSGPDPTGLQHAIAQAHAAPTSGDFFQRLLQMNEAGARGNELTTGLLNTLLDPTNLIGTGEGSAAKKGFQAVASRVDEPALIALARRAVENGVDPAALHPTDLFNAIDPADPARLDLVKALYAGDTGQRGNVPAQDLLKGVGISPRTGQGGARGLGPVLPGGVNPALPTQLPLVQQVAAQATPAALTQAAPAVAAAGGNDQRVLQLAALLGRTPTTAEIQRELRVGANEAWRLREVASGQAAKSPVPLTPQGAQDAAAPLLDQFPLAQAADAPGGAQAATGALDNGAAVLQTTPGVDDGAPASDLARMDLLRGKDLKQALDDLLTYNYGSAANRVVGNIVGKGHTFGPDYRVLDPQGQDVTRSLLDYLLRRSSLDEAGRAALGKELFPHVTRAGDRAATPPPAVDLATIHGPADLIDPPDAQDNLDRLRSLIVGEAQRVGTMYPPNDPQFYLKRIPTLTEGELPGFFRQLQQEGTLHFNPRDGYSVAADGPFMGGPMPDLNATPAIADQAPVIDQATPVIDQAATGGDTLGLLPKASRPGAINSGAVLGAFGGYGAADTTDQNRQDDLGGIVGGAALGALTGGAVTAPGAARFLRFAGTLGKEALAAQKDAFATGETKLGWRQLSGLWTVQQTATLKNLIQEYGSSLGFLANSGVRRQAVNENIRSMVDLRNAGARDPHATLPQAVQDKLAAIGKDQPVYAGGKRANQSLPANYQGANRASGYVLDLGHSFGNVMGHLEKQINPIRSAIAEAGFSLASPLAGVPAAGVVLGALKGLTRPAQQAVYTTINDIITLSFRSAVWEDAFDRQLAQNAGDFLGLVKQTTGRDLPLSADGLFSPADVKAQLQGVAPQVADNLARHWGELSQEAVKAGEDRAKQVFGDFSNASNAEKAFRTVVPFSSWVLRAIPRTVQLAMDHPAFTLAVLGLYADDAARAKREGRPGYQVGTVPIDSTTPVIGKVADVLTGGHGGTARLNPLGSFLPVPGAAFADESNGGPQTPYQNLEGLLGKTGFSFNPIVQAVAYAMNWDYQRPGALSRTSNYEQSLGGPDLPSIVNGPLDYVRKLNGGSVSNLTPEDRRLAQLFYEQYGKTINDPSMAQQAADTLNPNDPLRQEAAREAAQQGVARNTASLVSPVSLSASTGTEQAAAAARAADNAQKDQTAQAAQADPIAAMVQQKQAQDQAYLLQIMQQNYPVQYALMRQRGEIPGDSAQQPLLTLNRGADQQGRAYQALAAWEAQNTTLAYLAPSYYAAQRLALKQALGLPTTPGN